jgi:integrase
VRAKFDQAKVDVHQGLPLVDERKTLGDYLDQWLTTKRPEVEPSYWERCEQYVRLHIKPTLGKVSLAKLTPQQLQALYASKLHTGVAPRTVIHLHATIHVALEDALRLNLVQRNVADLVRPPKAPHVEMQTYTPAQAQQLLAAAQGDRLEALYVLMLTSACRLGELLGLCWDALDLERGEMRILSALKDVANTRTLGTPKTPRSRRTIPLTPFAVESLKRHHVNQTVERLKQGAGWNPQRLVFCTTSGTPYARSNFRYGEYRQLIARAGLPYIRPHDLRHTAATLLLLDEVQPIVVSEMLGHASVAFTLQTYGHVQAAMRKPARDSMERLFGQVYEPDARLLSAQENEA